MDLRVAALQKWSKISPARPESTVTERVLTRLTGLGRLSSLRLPSPPSSPPALSLLRALRRTSDMSGHFSGNISRVSEALTVYSRCSLMTV